jgi:hypothetical protein
MGDAEIHHIQSQTKPKMNGLIIMPLIIQHFGPRKSLGAGAKTGKKEYQNTKKVPQSNCLKQFFYKNVTLVRLLCLIKSDY